MLLSIIVPCRNERRFIDTFLKSVKSQVVPEGGFEVIIADGRSDDGTREHLAVLQRQWPNLRVIDNPWGIVSTGLNAAIKEARGDIIVRMDVHTEYESDYLVECVRALTESGAQNVGGPWRAVGQGWLQKAVAHAFRSRFASGGAASHRLDYEGDVDSVYLGCWRRSTLIELGLFDEQLVRNQDDELNLRIIRAGGRIWQTPRIRSRYSPRSSLSGLLWQYAQYGYWKVRVIAKHRMLSSLRHLVPVLFVLALLVLAAASVFFPGARLPLSLLVSVYLCFVAVASAAVSWNARDWRLAPLLPGVFMAFHVGYGLGFLAGLVACLRPLGRQAGVFTKITRH